MVFHYQVGEYVAAWLKAAQIDQDTKTPLFRAFTRTGAVSERPLVRRNVFDMIKRRVKAAGLPGTTTYHTFRATGITTDLENGGTLEGARELAAHAKVDTTRLYHRSGDRITVGEIERIRI